MESRWRTEPVEAPRCEVLARAAHGSSRLSPASREKKKLIEENGGKRFILWI